MQNNKPGFTLIEVLVSLTIFAVALLGMLGAIINIKEINTRNIIRDEAIKASQEIFNDLRNSAYTGIGNIGSTPCDPNDNSSNFTRQLRNFNILFGRTDNVAVSGNMKQVDMTLCWDYKGKRYEYKTSTLIRE
ncbi:prepilin-type N-terminal cleavage/methylation domain-containing protein [Deferribacteraceae bacterium V6Fe1]|nr:prepilin-type N-terminal cleavage/methylation domain-containing protein [Deferribacteraceae bacterium V6Fe1]